MVASCGVHGGPGTSLGGVQLQGSEPHHARPSPHLHFTYILQSRLEMDIFNVGYILLELIKTVTIRNTPF